jgi:hypothetical protein
LGLQAQLQRRRFQGAKHLLQHQFVEDIGGHAEAR